MNKLNVYEAALKRIKFLFDEFENVLVSFSGGKDSGVCLNLCYDYAKENNLLHKLAMYHLDYEAQYEMTTEHVTEVFNDYPEIKKYWLCLPIEAQCACRMDGAFWTPWAKENEDIWVREMPKNEFVLNEENSPFKVERGLTDKEMQDVFAKWFASVNGSTAIVVGIRCQESYDRLMIIKQVDRNLRYKKKNWTITTHLNNPTHGFTTFAYPIFDWDVEDVWIYFWKFQKKYNKLYDLYYQAGLTINQMRVASPFNNCAMDNLKFYKVIDPKNWGKMTGRVNGVNFAGLYGGTTAMGWKRITKPKHFTWKEYCFFLLNTLPEKVKNHYMKKLEKSKRSWVVGGVMDDDTIADLVAENAPCIISNEIKKGTKTKKKLVKFNDYVDDTTAKNFRRIPSYKRMCVCIIKNDYFCQYMGFAKTKEEMEKRKNALDKYRSLL